MNDQSFEVNLIESLTSEHSEEIELEAECKFELESEDFNLDKFVNSAMNWVIEPNFTKSGANKLEFSFH